MHLWEVNHPYYCNEGNYFTSSPELESRYHTWAEFAEEQGDADFDMNLVFRWDWKEGEDYGASKFTGDVNYRNGRLSIYWMGQRKGIYRWTIVEVCRADEPAVRTWLEERWQHLQKLWTPLSAIEESA